MAETVTDIILHPVRMRVLMTISGRQLTTQEIGAALPDVAQASLYRHLRRMAKADILTVVAQRPVRGVMEKVYALTGNGISLAADASRMTLDDWHQAFAAFTTSLLGQFGVYLRQQQANPLTDGVTFRTAPVYLSDEELRKFFNDLNAVIVPALSRGSAPGRRRRLLSTILIPDADLPDADLNDSGETE